MWLITTESKGLWNIINSYKIILSYNKTVGSVLYIVKLILNISLGNESGMLILKCFAF